MTFNTSAILTTLLLASAASVGASEPESLSIRKLERFGPFSFRDLEGRTWTERDLVGRVTVVEFWATHCGPCVRAFPEFQRFHERVRKDASIRFVTINVDEDGEKIGPWLAEVGRYSFPVLLAGKGAHPPALPTTIVLDREGYVREILRGAGPDWAEDMRVVADAVGRRLPVRMLR